MWLCKECVGQNAAAAAAASARNEQHSIFKSLIQVSVYVILFEMDDPKEQPEICHLKLNLQPLCDTEYVQPHLLGLVIAKFMVGTVGSAAGPRTSAEM